MKAATPKSAEHSFNYHTRTIRDCRAMMNTCRPDEKGQQARKALLLEILDAKNALAQGALAHQTGRFDDLGGQLVVSFVKNPTGNGDHRFDPCVSVHYTDDKRGAWLETRVLFCDGSPAVNLATAVEFARTYATREFPA